MIFDLILAGIFITLIIINAKRGAARALAGIFASVVSYAAATVLGRLAAAYLYEWLFKPSVDRAVSDAVGNLGENAAMQLTDALPSWLSGALGLSGVDLPTVVSDNLSDASSLAAQAVDNAIRPVVVGLLTFFITILLFFFFLWLLRKLILNPLLGLFKLPVIRTVNTVIGAVIGFVDAFLLVSMLAYLLKLLLPELETKVIWLNESTIYNSFIFYHFYSGNIFTAITNWIGL